jgi:glycosyltransferase involved in cell wall biosynthesis
LKIGIDGNEANLENRVGVNQYAAELLCALEKLPETQVHEWIIYLQNKPLPHLPKERSGWKYIITDRGIVGKIKAAWSTKPDVYFAPTHYLPPLLPCKSVMSVMDLGYLNFPNQFRKKDFIQLKYWTKASLRWSNAVLAISKSTKDEIIKNYPWAKNKITVTYLGYDKEKYKYAKAKKDDYILYIGTLKPSKNVEGLVGAFSELITHHPSRFTKYKLVIAGKK